MRRELEDEQSRWGEQIREERKKIGMESVKQWCEKVEEWGWLASAGLAGSRRRASAAAQTDEARRARDTARACVT